MIINNLSETNEPVTRRIVTEIKKDTRAIRRLTKAIKRAPVDAYEYTNNDGILIGNNYIVKKSISPDSLTILVKQKGKATREIEIIILNLIANFPPQLQKAYSTAVTSFIKAFGSKIR